MENQRINVLINLGNLVLCEALQGLFEKHPSVYSAVLARHMQREDRFTPDKIIVDDGTLDRSLHERWPKAKLILMDTGLTEERVISLLISYNLHGVISTGTSTELFHKALRTIRANQVWIDNDKVKALLQSTGPNKSTDVKGSEGFSKREKEIVFLVADGLKNREIAERLNSSEQTIKSHISNIFKKANVTRRVQLAFLAIKLRQ